MLFDANTADRSRFDQNFDVCIVGSGPAGLTLARKLAANGLQVALMEGGEFDLTTESQDLYMGETVGHDYFPPDVPRLRFFGGSSNHWSGRCRPLDTHDFIARDYHPLSGWPITKAELDPYQPETAEILDLASPVELPDLPLTQAQDRLRLIQWQFSPPTRFNAKYRDEITDAERIALCINANLVDLRLDDALGHVTEAIFKSYTPGDPGFSVRARVYCLCTGGLENARLLLNFTSQMPQGIGNGHDLVGRYFCEHPTIEMGDVIFTAPQDYQQISFAPSEAFIESEQILNFTTLVEFRIERRPESFVKSLSTTAQCITPGVHQLVEDLRDKQVKCYWGGVDEFFVRSDPQGYPYGYVWGAVEQQQNPDSRVLLADEVDPLGLRQIRIDWQLTELDMRSFKAAALAMGAYFAEQNIGRLRLRDWLQADAPVLPTFAESQGHVAGQHHMSTTRMADDPRQGVVDRNCRVHGIDNLYIGGSSVFTTVGYANPTHTIVQLALRLGDHLTQELQAS